MVVQRSAKTEGFPAWVVPRWHEVTDLTCLAARTVESTNCPTRTRLTCGGMMGAADWVRDLLFGPVTGRDEVPVSLAVARVEMATAGRVLDGRPEQLVRELCVSLGVRYWSPLENLGRDFVLGAWSTLQWLTGELEEPPLPVPLRHPDGSLVTAAYIYDAMVRVEPGAGPTRRADLRRQAGGAAEQSYMLARMIREHVDAGRHARG